MHDPSSILPFNWLYSNIIHYSCRLTVPVAGEYILPWIVEHENNNQILSHELHDWILLIQYPKRSLYIKIFLMHAPNSIKNCRQLIGLLTDMMLIDNT